MKHHAPTEQPDFRLFLNTAPPTRRTTNNHAHTHTGVLRAIASATFMVVLHAEKIAGQEFRPVQQSIYSRAESSVKVSECVLPSPNELKYMGANNVQFRRCGSVNYCSQNQPKWTKSMALGHIDTLSATIEGTRHLDTLEVAARWGKLCRRSNRSVATVINGRDQILP